MQNNVLKEYIAVLGRAAQHMRNFIAVTAISALSAVAAFGVDLKAGQAAYDRECVDCHAMNGAPVASVAKAMKKQQIVMRSLASMDVQAQTDATWKKMILEGTGKMKPIKTMNAAEIENVSAFMRAMKKK